MTLIQPISNSVGVVQHTRLYTKARDKDDTYSACPKRMIITRFCDAHKLRVGGIAFPVLNVPVKGKQAWLPHTSNAEASTTKSQKWEGQVDEWGGGWWHCIALRNTSSMLTTKPGEGLPRNTYNAVALAGIMGLHSFADVQIGHISSAELLLRVFNSSSSTSAGGSATI